jgi:hypothetical protein
MEKHAEIKPGVTPAPAPEKAAGECLKRTCGCSEPAQDTVAARDAYEADLVKRGADEVARRAK